MYFISFVLNFTITNTVVGSILYYTPEIWGFTKRKEIESIHVEFDKTIIKFNLNTCIPAVYFELGRYPL